MEHYCILSVVEKVGSKKATPKPVAARVTNILKKFLDSKSVPFESEEDRLDYETLLWHAIKANLPKEDLL